MEEFNTSGLPKWEDDDEIEMLDVVSAEEFARQITICDQYNFSAITCFEFMGCAWSKSTKAINAPNITNSIKLFNRLGHWYATEIVRRRNQKKRLHALQLGIDIAMELFKLNNFNSCMSIYAALSSTAVQRLKKTWANVTPESKAKYTSLQQALQHSKNYKPLRRLFAFSSPPVIPYLGLYLQDLTFIEEMPTRLEGNKINFFKSQKVYTTISEVLRYQKDRYSFSPNEKVMRYFLSVPEMNETELYQESLAVEPRNPDEALENLMEQQDNMKRTIRRLEDQLAQALKQGKKLERMNERLVARNLQITDALVCILEQNDEKEVVPHDYSAILESCGFLPPAEDSPNRDQPILVKRATTKIS